MKKNQHWALFTSTVVLISSMGLSAHAETRRVLVLNAYHEGFHWTDRIMAGVKSVFDDQYDVELFINYMDTKRHSEATYFEKLRDIYIIKYQHLKFDAIVSSDDHALNFLLKYRDELFPGVPVFFSAINDFHPGRIVGHNLFTGVYETYDVTGTVELMLRLHPETRSIAVVLDTSISGMAFRDRIERAEPSFVERVRFEYLSNLNKEDLRKTLRELPTDALVLWAIYLRTPQGGSLSSEESVRLVTTSSDRPTYCLWDVVGQGVVGGKITSPNFQGEAAARMALNFLRGKPFENMPVSGSPMTFLFDFNALQRYDIQENSLPPDSIILNRPFSVFREYKLTILLVVFLIVTLVLIIATLVRLIHKRKQAEEALLVSQQLLAQSSKMEAIGQLAGGVAHDFNNMLSGITGAADLLDRTATGKDRELVTIILTSAQRASHLTSKLLAFGRKGVIATAPVDIHGTIENAVDILKLSLNRKTTIVSALAAQHSVCVVDESQITNALFNLGINADHAMENGGKLTYETRNVSLESEYCTVCPFDIEPGEYLSIGVRDTGCGMAPEDLTKIFEPFYTTKEQGKGTGLGLSSVYGTIQEHQGAVTVCSEIDSGTLFQICLPLCSEEVPKTNSDFFPRLGEGELILVVDDEEVIRATAQTILTQHNYKVVTATNGREAVDIFTKRHAEIDLVLMDMIMPEMSGREAQERIMEFNKDVRVILSSGFTRDHFIDLASNTRPVAFLRKPYRRAELCRAVSEVLQEELEVSP